MAKKTDYDLNLLTIYLMSRSKKEVKMSIDKIERIACGKLPDFMHTHSGSNRFWYNDYDRNPSYAHYWLDAGYIAHPDFKNSVVYFTKSDIKRIKRKANKKPVTVKKADMNIDTAVNAIKKYHYSIDENYTRYKSWEHCYNAFKKYRKDGSKTEFLCLHLSCFLASWGMLRSSSLMKYDYFVHKKFVEEIRKSRYDSLYSENCDIDTVFQAVEAIKNSYPKDISLTDTLKTKILLGVFGCVPAYDRYFKKAVKIYNVCSSDFNEKSLSQLYSFYNENKGSFDKLQKQFESEGAFYTPMKLVDMCFWQIGFDLENDEKKTK